MALLSLSSAFRHVPFIQWPLVRNDEFLAKAGNADGVLVQHLSRSVFSIRMLRYWWVGQAITEESRRQGRPLRVLDVGCERGWLKFFTPEGAVERWVGLDWDVRRECLENARYDEVIRANFDEVFPVESGCMDVVVNNHVMEHLPRPGSTMAEISREQRAATLKRELENSHRLAEFKDEIAFKEQVNRWTNEFQLNEMERDRLISLRSIAIDEEKELAEVQKGGKVRLTAVEYAIQESNIRERHDRERRRLDKEQETIMDREDIKTWALLRAEQLAAMARMYEIKTKEKTDIIQASKDVHPINLAGALGGDQGRVIVDAIKASHAPQPHVTVVTHGGLQGSFAPMQAGVFSSTSSVPSFMQSYAPGYGGSGFEVHAQRYEPSVGICSMSLPGAGEPTPVGTAWLVAGRSCFVTNAHVAVTLLEAREQAGMSIWVTLAGQSTALPVGRILVHPNYALSKQRKDPLPTHDFAILHIDVPLPPGIQGLPLASRARLMALREMQSVGYLGFPFENLVGSVLLRSPKPTAQKGSISALQPWDFSHSADPSRCQLIKHNLGVAGGASGSPLFDESGDVIGVITAGNMERLYDPKSPTEPRRVPSGVALNFAQRIDVLLDWMGW